ncbi:amidase [Tomitella biformata]|uniref:amidase n=1 Tax=Tomitella biformata TaxID=630403 RepID=UPI0004659B90|nr:amidase [Tomitella biformata]
MVGASALEIARAVTAREISAREVIEQHLSHIAETNTRLNAILTVPAEQAIEAAAELDRRLERGESVGVLAGVPFSVKDLIATAGVRTTAGSEALLGNVPDTDAPAVARMRAEGAILIGKTNTPEFGASGLTHNEYFGNTVSPLAPEGIALSPGGSSGGESATIASGMSAAGLGTDFGGSVRWPAHCTGLCSVRPTAGRVADDGQYPGVMTGSATVSGGVLTNPVTLHGAVQMIGPLARDLDDLTALLKVLSEPQFRWVDPATVDVSALDVRWADGEGNVPVAEEIKATVAALAARLQPAVGSIAPYSGQALSQAEPLFSAMRARETQTDVTQYGPPAGFSGNTQAFLSAVRPVSTIELEAGWSQRTLLVDQFLSEIGDLLVMPVASIVAPGVDATEFPVGDQVLTWAQALASSRAISILGVPSVVVPVGTSASGLPIGVQIVAKPFHEHEALALAALCWRAVDI